MRNIGNNSRSTEKLATIATLEVAAVIATIYGGYRLIGRVLLLKDFLKETFKTVGKLIIKLLQ